MHLHRPFGKFHAYFAMTLLMFLWGTALVPQAWSGTGATLSEDHEVRVARAEKVAETFAGGFSTRTDGHLQAMRFSYEVHMELDAFVRTTMEVTLQMKKKEEHYVSLFHLTEPEGKNLWSRFALFVYGRHTEDYRVLKTRVDTTIEETFTKGANGFMTLELKEVVPKQEEYDNQTGIRILFDYQRNLVKFWEDQTRKDWSRSIPYESQTGPLAAFFNFVLFRDPRSTFTIINALKRTETVASENTQSTQKNITFLFANERVRLQRNATDKYTEFGNAVYFESPNYLDIIYGQNIYYDIVYNATSNIKIPYSVLLEGLISRSKQKERERRLKELMDRPMGHEALQERLRSLNQMNVLAAKNVRVYLKDAEAVWR